MIDVNEKFLEIFVRSSVEIHDNLIVKSGGLAGTKSIGLLESAISSLAYCETFDEQITNLVFSIAKNHAFIDGNKRSSIAIGAYFLAVYGYSEFIIGRFIVEMEDIILMVVCRFIDKEDLGEFVSLIINDLPYHEELQIKWILAKQKVDELYGD